MHLSIGQEAIAAGVSTNLTNSDQVVSNHRCHAHYLSMNGDLKAMFCELYGKSNGTNGGRGGSMNLFDKKKNLVLSLPIVGSTIPIGVGLALEKKIKKKNNITVIFLGDAATEEGVFYESLNFAKLFNLKCIFVIENNLYSVYTSIKDRRKSGISEINNILNIKTYNGNGMDYLEVYNKVERAKKYIKNNSQPAIVILDTYRWLEHCGPNNDDFLKYREKKEIVKWKKKCPLKLMINYLIKNKYLTHEKIKKITKKINNEIENSIKYAENAKFPKLSEASSKVYAK